MTTTSRAPGALYRGFTNAVTHRQSSCGPALVTTLTMESFEQRVQALGFTTTRGSAAGKPDPYFTFIVESRKVGVLLENPAVLELFVSYKDGSTPNDLNDLESRPFWDYGICRCKRQCHPEEQSSPGRRGRRAKCEFLHPKVPRCSSRLCSIRR